MPELYKKTFSDEKKRSDHSRKKENGGKKEKFSSWAALHRSLVSFFIFVKYMLFFHTSFIYSHQDIGFLI